MHVIYACIQSTSRVLATYNNRADDNRQGGQGTDRRKRTGMVQSAITGRWKTGYGERSWLDAAREMVPKGVMMELMAMTILTPVV